ncbi:MAG TPA: HD domain-containing protein [Gemmatimonadaceae bacterium]|nr:HD domain-containing protein [Gemmatimonadaceae bacterium]
MSALDLASLEIGDRVQHELMVRSREDKVTKNGDPFAVLQLGNSSGQISANVWKEQLPFIEGVRAGCVVQVIGVVDTYQGRRQLKISAPLRVIAPAAVNIDEFLPRVNVDVVKLWETVDKWRREMKSQKLRLAVDLFFADDAFRAQFERAPGAAQGHHAQIGGLLLHVVEVGAIARASAKAMRGDVDLVTAGALLHDIGKVETFTITAAGFDFTQGGILLQHMVLGSLLLDRRLRTLPEGTLTEAQELELQHFIQAHPMTLEAELLHLADQTSMSGSNFTSAVENSW